MVRRLVPLALVVSSAACGGEAKPPAEPSPGPVVASADAGTVAPAPVAAPASTGGGEGLGNIGTLGHADAGTDDSAKGFGNGHGRLGGAHGTSTPSIRQGATQVDGRLPPEVIQRVARQSFGMFRLCYEDALKVDATLTGRVSTKFVIDRTGAVSSAADGGSDLPNAAMVACVVKVVAGLKFPQPEGGIVTVVYPLVFSPGDDAKK